MGSGVDQLPRLLTVYVGYALRRHIRCDFEAYEIVYLQDDFATLYSAKDLRGLCKRLGLSPLRPHV